MSRRAYDHRIKEEIVRAGDPDLFPELGIPRSTAVSSIRRGLGEVVPLDQGDQDERPLRQPCRCARTADRHAHGRLATRARPAGKGPADPTLARAR
jgi:hypothetical protein